MAVAFRRAAIQILSRPGDDTALDITGTITLCMFVKLFSLPSVAGEEFVLMGKLTDSGTNLAYDLEVRNTGDVMRFRRSTNGTTSISHAGTTALVAGVWYFLAATWDGAFAHVYLGRPDLGTIVEDEVALASTGNTFNSTESFAMGDRSDSQKGAAADIADARVYRRALSIMDLGTIMAKRGKDRMVDGLVARWPLNDGPVGDSAGQAADVGPNGLVLMTEAGVGVPTWSESIVSSRPRMSFRRLL